jgi:hypothetical protein
VSWPTPQEYNEAIQNPAQNVADPELRSGSVETTALGLPRPITGNFASVYRLNCSGRDWAVRCFWREYADMQQRYAAISAHLRSHPLPYTVGFEYLPQGIRVRGVWYPILKMEWVEGELLGAYVERHLRDTHSLTSLANRWREMVLALEDAGVAHGDLQHGNVLVVKGALRLVDYDAMYVPALRGKGSHELGHQHYQHPGRTERDFGPGLDRFSALVIECSLRALAREPDLWSTLQAGDESLLFRRGDLTDPNASPAFRLLLAQADPEVVRLAGLMRTALAGKAMTAPSLRPPSAPRAPARRLPPPIRAVVGLAAAAPSAGAESTGGASATPGWLADHLPERTHPRPSRRVRRLAGALASVGALWLLAGLASGVPSLIVFAGAVAGLVASVLVLLAAFNGEDEVQAMKRKLRQERRQRQALAALEREMARYERRETRLQARFARRERKARETLRRMGEHEHRDLAVIADLRHEADERASQLTAALATAEREAVRSALEAAHRRHVRTQLRRQTIRRAPLSMGIRARLWIGGVHSAADVDMDRMKVIHTLGKDIAGAIAAWRVDAELAARKGAPTVLPAPELHRLTERFGRERTQMLHEQQLAMERAGRAGVAVTAHWTRRKRPIGQRLARREASMRAGCRDLDAAMEDVRLRMEPLQAHLARAQRELEPFGGLSFGRYVAGAVTGRVSTLT